MNSIEHTTMQDMATEMEFTTETVEVEEISEEGVPTKKLKKVVKAFDPKFVTDWKNDPNYKSWIEKTKTDDETVAVTTYEFDSSEPTECIEIEQNGQQRTVQVVKTVRKSNPGTATAPVKNNRSTKRQVKMIDPNMPAFVCTEHNENITLDCRYCRIASGFKKKSAQKYVQNDEISSSGKVTVAIPRREPNVKTQTEGLFEGNVDTLNSIVTPDVSANLTQKNQTPKQSQKFRSEWLTLPEFKDWLVEFKTSEDANTSQAKCKYCGTLLVNNSNNLVRHAISKKHTKNMQLEILGYESAIDGQGLGGPKPAEGNSKEEIFGRYVATELKRIKSKKTYEEVKWKILQALQTAAEKEADDPDMLT